MTKLFYRKKRLPNLNFTNTKTDSGNSTVSSSKRLLVIISTAKSSFLFCLLLFAYVNVKPLIYLLNRRIWSWAWSKRVSDKLLSGLYLLAEKLHRNGDTTINWIDLIEMSLRNMKVKKTRTLVTVGGMAIGVGSIVFLVSIGYGLQRLVVGRVARLDELRQTDVFVQTGSKVRINDKLIYSLKEITGVKSVLPLIAVVGRVNYQNSSTDLVIYGVTSGYLQESAIKPIEGQVFTDKLTPLTEKQPIGQVAGVKTETESVSMNQPIGEIDFSINPNQWLKIRQQPTTKSPILGYTRRVEGKQTGQETWGGYYLDDNGLGEAGLNENSQALGRWINTKVYLWEKTICDDSDGGCEDGMYRPLRDENGDMLQKEGYFAEINIVNNTKPITPKVLGVETTATKKVSKNLEGIDWVEIASESGIGQSQEIKKVDLPITSLRQILINQSMQKLLGLKDGEVVNKTVNLSFVVVSDLLEDTAKKIESNPANYTITGVVPEGNNPIAYVHFDDLKNLGVVNYSQTKVVVEDPSLLAKTRNQINSMGFVTRSVVDTVAQIDSLFNTARIVLALLGMVALAVAALGMFNTLTVSLMERTREVGLMKALGMKSSEVRELFLAESMVMGLLGGLSGIAFGFIAGKVVGLLLTSYALLKGVGIIDISYIPPLFIAIIIVLSLFIGVFTGLYPARRATKISALNALRYE